MLEDFQDEFVRNKTRLANPYLRMFFLADNFRPYITSFQGNNCTDYINAVFVDVSNNKFSKSTLHKYIHLQGYTHPREYIVTEWPVVSTCSDLWSLVYDHDCSAVVVLCNPSPGVSNVSFNNFPA